MKPTGLQIRTFADKMAQLLFEMRIEQDIPYGNDCEPVPQEWAEKIIDDPEHIENIKHRIRMSIIETLGRNPMQFWNEEKGDYEYHTDTFDHAFCVDGYLDELYEKQRQERITKKWKIWIEVERIEYDPETNEEDYIDEGMPFAIRYCDSLEEVIRIREQINDAFGEINPPQV